MRGIFVYIRYLGHEISGDGVQPGDKKMQVVSNFPPSENVHGTRQFVGLAGYFRKLVQNFAVIARQLTDLMVLGTSQIKAFEMVMQWLVAKLFWYGTMLRR